jgi:putative flavoprotein involved in K+ transport
VPAKDFATYLQSFPSRFQINVKTNSQVKKVEKENQVYTVDTSKGKFRSSIVVNCTGYYSSPFIPNYAGLESTEMLKLHFKDYRNIKSLEGSKKVLVLVIKLQNFDYLLFRILLSFHKTYNHLP